VNDSLPEPIKYQTKQNLNSPLKFLLIILGLLLVILLGETIFLTVMKNRNKGFEAKNQKEAGIPEEKITPAPTVIESSWNGRATKLVKGKVSDFDTNNRKINLILEDNTTKIIDIDDKTGFVQLKVVGEQVAPVQLQVLDASTFWLELKKDDKVSCSCYEGSNLAVSIAKEVN